MKRRTAKKIVKSTTGRKSTGSRKTSPRRKRTYRGATATQAKRLVDRLRLAPRRAEFAAKRKEYVDSVRHPGKFEGLAPYVPYFWEGFLDGTADYADEQGGILAFAVSEEDRQIFPVLGRRRTVYLYERGDGSMAETTKPSARERKAVRCACADSGCPVHRGVSRCTNAGETLLRRTDMADDGDYFCEACAEDAYDSGMFA